MPHVMLHSPPSDAEKRLLADAASRCRDGCDRIAGGEHPVAIEDVPMDEWPQFIGARDAARPARCCSSRRATRSDPISSKTKHDQHAQPS